MWTICTDVKLPSVCFVFWSTIFLPYMQGGSESHSIHCPTKTVVWDCDIGTDHPDVPAIFQFIVNGNRLSQVPACRSKPFHFLHCCRNLEFYFFWVLLHQNLLQSKDVESILRTELHDGSTIFSCQTVLDCLCTFDAFHISNSIRYFWASVCVTSK